MRQVAAISCMAKTKGAVADTTVDTAVPGRHGSRQAQREC